jgi:hypothetical protein
MRSVLQRALPLQAVPNNPFPPQAAFEVPALHLPSAPQHPAQLAAEQNSAVQVL